MDADKPPHSRDSGDCAAEGRGGTAAERRTGQRHGGGCLKGGGRSGENGQNLKMKKKARWSLAAVERKGMRSKPPRCPLGDGRPRGAEGRWGAATGNRGGLNRNLYEEICLLCVAYGEKMRGRACRVGGAKPAAGVCVPKCTACCVEIAVGRPKGAATIETPRHYKLSRAPRYHRLRASVCRSAPSRYGKRGRGRSGRRCGEATT